MDATIEVTKHEIYGSNCYCTFKWIGSKNKTACLNKRYYDRYKDILPWKLKVIEFDYMRCSYIVARQEGALFISGIAHWLKAALKRNYYAFKIRVILTCAVWSLGYIPENEKVSWKHIFKKHRQY